MTGEEERSDDKISLERLKRDLHDLGEIGKDEAGGLTRLSLSKEDMEARSLVAKLMLEPQLDVRVDQAANIIATRPGKSNHLPPVAVGSHIDTVRNGGRLDGALGVMAAIEVIRTLNDNNIRTRRPIEVIVFTNEEGVRYPVLMGSRAMAGQLDINTLYSTQDSGGVTFRDALIAAGYKLDELTPVLRKPGDIHCFMELHIEQGPVLEREGLTIGVVEAIVGITHLMVSIEGVSGHAGTVPMNGRKDPLVGAAGIISEVNQIAKSASPSSVGTVGLMRIYPSVMNVIPKRVEMGIDLRDRNSATLAGCVEKVKVKVEEICSNSSLQYRLEQRGASSPVSMSEKVVKTIEASASRLGLPWKRMSSGAGHDTQNMALITDAGMIFVPSRNGLSHVPEEFTEWNQIEAGVNVLLRSMLDLADQI